VSIDDAKTQFQLVNGIASCKLAYYASGNGSPPYTGQTPGTYTLFATVKFAFGGPTKNKQVGGNVTCQ
jgi:hypothetical protein